MDLFLDGTFSQTITNLPPSTGNALSVTLNSTLINYTVPANATVASVVTGLAAAVNARTSTTHVQAYPTGDRLEFQSLDESVPGGNVTLSASASKGTAAQLTTLLTPTRPTFLDTAATGYLGVLAQQCLQSWAIGSSSPSPKPTARIVTVAVTNTTSGTTIVTLAQNLVNLVNATPALQSADGVWRRISPTSPLYGYVAAQFTLYARSPGWPASQIQVTFTASAESPRPALRHVLPAR